VREEEGDRGRRKMEIGKGRRHDAGDDGGDGGGRVSKKRVGVGWGRRVGGTERARRGGRGGVVRWTRGVKACGGGAEVRGEVA
jgi:hypothetical protein